MDGVKGEDYFDIAIKLEFYTGYLDADFQKEFDKLVEKYSFEKEFYSTECELGWKKTWYIKTGQTMKIRDRIEPMELFSIERNDPIPRPYEWHIRERINKDGTVTEISRKKIYDTIL